MAKGRQLKGRIRSVQNTRKITRTMELVSTSKLKRAQDRVGAARPYAEALREVIADLVSRGYTVELYGVGKKGIGFFKYLRRKLALERLDIGDKPTADHAAE